ncbi:MAG: arabinan endo-1,5-alpha-L-arabinosidase [Clostridia bacterium]|nr:arabinan endo-1,5-alpha-L-arabinosidase [Clostridia bacterium]
MKKFIKILCIVLCLTIFVNIAGCEFSFMAKENVKSDGAVETVDNGKDKTEREDDKGEEEPTMKTLTELDEYQNYTATYTALTPSGSCHDPAVFKDGNVYYLFGTNSTTKFSSTNLINWQFEGQVFNNLASDMQNHVIGGSGYWAPDIIKYGNQYRLYYCLSAFGTQQSAIGFATANNVNGPYTHQGIVIKSKDSDPNSLPNAIDPNVVTDKDGKMWLCYGSFFGGIYIIELDPATGFVKSGSGYEKNVDVSVNAGTKICAGNMSVGPEGPYIIYNPNTGYYYLFVSYGNLFSDYNVRVGRSKNITGPYTYGSNDGIEMQNQGGAENNHGNKVIGGYDFNLGGVSRMAPGHCSVLYDNGSYYMVNHVRNTGNSFDHYVQVHKILFNEKGWPCVLPNTYAGEKVQNIGTANLVGKWKAITFIKNNNNTIVAEEITVSENKSVSGAITGSIQAYEKGAIRLTVTSNSCGDEELYQGIFSGFVISGYDYDLRKSTLFISAVNEYGYSIVAEKV